MGYTDSSNLPKWASKNINLLQMVILIIGLVAGAFKIYHDLATQRDQVVTNKEQIYELKKKASEDNKIINELKTNSAVMRSELEGVRRQNTALLIKVEKIYDLMIDKRNEKK